MTRLYEDESSREDLRESGRDREISLGTGVILGIFLALAVVCAIFFGFGYALGRRSAAPLATTVAQPTAEPQVSMGGHKPTPGIRSGSQPDQEPDSPGTTYEAAGSPRHGTTRITAALGDRASDGAPSDAQSRTVPPRSADNIPLPSPTIESKAAVTPTGTSFVQIAAVSHKEDADLLLSSLRKKGYSVAVRQMPQDKLLHVQIGPMANKKEADGMRKRLQADGYNAIVK